MTDLTAKHFHEEDAAIAHIERSRWPNGDVVCPHCGSLSVHRMAGKTQAGMFLCNDCRDKFTCRTGTVMERSHVPLHKWLLAIHLMPASKKGMSAHQLMRNLGLAPTTAWFLARRIREAMTDDEPNSQRPIRRRRTRLSKSTRHMSAAKAKTARIANLLRRKPLSALSSVTAALRPSTLPTSPPRPSAQSSSRT